MSGIPQNYTEQIRVENGVTYYTGTSYPSVAFFDAHWRYGKGSTLIIPSNLVWEQIADKVPGMSELKAVEKILSEYSEKYPVGYIYDVAAPKIVDLYMAYDLKVWDPVPYSLGKTSLTANMHFEKTAENTLKGSVFYQLRPDEFDWIQNTAGNNPDNWFISYAKEKRGTQVGPGTAFKINFSGDTALKIEGTVTDFAPGSILYFPVENSARTKVENYKPSSKPSDDSGGQIANPGILIPTDAPTRNSASYITDTNPNDHYLVIKRGGAVWDAFVAQKNRANSFSDWEEFKAAVSASNPNIRNLNEVPAGTALYLPEKQRDGSITYHYSSGASINNNATTGAYQMLIPDSEGGGTIQYIRTADGDAGHTVRQVSTDATGNVIEEFTGWQSSLDSDITWTSARDQITPGVIDTWKDTNADGRIDQHTLQIDTQPEPGPTPEFQPPAPETGKTFDLTQTDSRLDAEYQLSQLHNQSLIPADYYQSFTEFTSNALVGNAGFDLGTGLLPHASGLGLNPIGAFYDSQSSAHDNAPSIARHTGVLLDANWRAVDISQLTARDADRDDQLNLQETAGLMLWQDLNENGQLNEGELSTLTAALVSKDYAALTRGNGRLSAGEPFLPQAPGHSIPVIYDRTESVPDSNYRYLRDNNNRYYLNAVRWYQWSSNEIKVSSDNKHILIGTDGDDSFGVQWFSTLHGIDINLFTHFLAGDGNDEVGGSVRNDLLWGGTGNDHMWGDAGDDKLYGEDGQDHLYGETGNDYLDGGADRDRLFGYAGDDVLIGRDGDDTLVGFNPTNDSKQWLDAGETDNDYLDGGNGADILLAGLGNDTLIGGNGDDYLDGGSGADILFGGADQDELRGRDDDDVLVGDSGDDKIFGDAGNDTLHGGEGNDILVGFAPTNEAASSNPGLDNDMLFGEGGNDNLYGDIGDDMLDGGTGDDILMGEQGHDKLFGGDGSDELQGNEGNDTLQGGNGNDRLFGQLGDDLMWGGEGDDYLQGFTASNEARQSLSAGETDNDRLFGGAGSDILIGGLGDDELFGGTGRDELQGNEGNDLLYGEDGDDNLFGQVGDDVLYGGDGNDYLQGFTASNEAKRSLDAGQSDNDKLYGGAGTDTLVGGLGDDYLDGGAGADIMVGGAGNDTYIVNSVNDTLYELAGEGYDIVITSTNYLLNAHLEELRLLEGFSIHGTGNAQNNRIIGNSSDNILDGVTGADTMVGGGGNDTYYIDNLGDVIVERAGEGSDTVQSSVSYALGSNLENLTLLDFAAPEKGLVDGREVWVYGYPKRNELDYMQGDEVDAFAGTCGLTSIANLLTQTGQPTTESDIVNLAIRNNWTVNDPSLPAYELGGTTLADQLAILDEKGLRSSVIYGYNEAGLANLMRSGRGVILTVNAGKLWGEAAYVQDGWINHAVTLTGAVYDAADNTLKGFYLADSGRGRVSDMTRFVDIAAFRDAANAPGAYAIYTLEPVKFWQENINATGNSLNNVLTGNRGDNVVDGGAGADTLIGGAGDDTYIVDQAGDIIREAGNQGNDTVRSGISWTLADNLENLILTGKDATRGVGNALDNRLTGNAASNVLEGGSGDDWLDGGAGADSLIGGLGNDSYRVDHIGDMIREWANQGGDSVWSSLDWVLGDNLENLTLLGGGDLKGTGNALDNVIRGNAGRNTLDGGGGADTLIGGAGDDIYFVDRADDTVIEAGNAGKDTVNVSLNWTLGANLENLTLLGRADLTGTGNALDNVIQGNAGRNTLDGGGGTDTLIGGAGDDIYFVDRAGDAVIEAVNAGKDTVNASLNWTLGANLENLTLLGRADLTGTGNALDNVIQGNAGRNTLDGGGGTDTLIGGAGDDIYFVDRTGDAVIEAVNAGIDTVNASLSWTLGANLENLTLLGGAHLNGTGNALNNVLTGNAGNNRLDGGSGADRLLGGAGDDTYLVDNSLDVVIESAGNGMDTVIAGLNWTLGANLEMLRLSGNGNLSGSGNALANVLFGNGGANTLDGAAGNDILQAGDGSDVLLDLSGRNLLDGGAGNDVITSGGGSDFIVGGAGNDTLNAGAGNDVLAFNRGHGQDVVVTTGTGKTLSLGGVRYADLTFRKVNKDLVLGTGGSNQVMLKDWYASIPNRGVSRLQVSIEGTPDYNPKSTNKLNNSKMETFDFLQLARVFEQAQEDARALVGWSLGNGLQKAHLGGSNSAALGGDLAYHYARSGNFAGLGSESVLGLLGDSGFGLQPQGFQATPQRTGVTLW